MAQQTALALINGQISEIPSTDTIRGAAGGSSSSITQLSADPASPTAQQAWVLATSTSTGGTPMGLLLSITKPSSVYSYALKYRTLEGTTVATPLT